ncbi:MAG: DnaJ domain-containing protein [Bdellovibrionota bacterium]
MGVLLQASRKNTRQLSAKFALLVLLSLIGGTEAQAQLNALMPTEATAPEEHRIDSSSSYYEILDVPFDANPETILKAYRRLVKRYHPDINKTSPDNERILRLINEAYEVLSDPEKKVLYDNGTAKWSKEFNLDPLKFIRGDEVARTKIMKYLDDGGSAFSERFTEAIGTLARTSKPAFEALVWMVKFKDYIYSDPALRIEAFEALIKARPYRPEVWTSYKEALSFIINQIDRPRQKNGSRFVFGMVVEGFLTDQTIAPEVFRSYFSVFIRRMLKSHVNGWEALGKELNRINATYPDLMKEIVRLNGQALKRMAETGRNIGFVSGFHIGSNLIAIAELRPDLEKQILRLILKNKEAFPGDFSQQLIRSATESSLAYKALEILLNENFQLEKVEELRNRLNSELYHFERDKDKKDSVRRQNDLRVVALIKKSRVYQADYKPNFCPAVFKKL